MKTEMILAGVRTLNDMGFDPLRKLVEKYEELEEESDYQKKLRSGEVTQFNAQGKVVSFYADNLNTIHDKQIKIAETLLRYKYARVPETQVIEGGETKGNSSLIINLTKKGDQYRLNQGSIDQPDSSGFEFED
jgi:hypothetical protein